MKGKKKKKVLYEMHAHRSVSLAIKRESHIGPLVTLVEKRKVSELSPGFAVPASTLDVMPTTYSQVEFACPPSRKDGVCVGRKTEKG
jgi:hypothetical protein